MKATTIAFGAGSLVGAVAVLMARLWDHGRLEEAAFGHRPGAASSADRQRSAKPYAIAVGDSLTQQGFSGAGGWLAGLANDYTRRMDWLNRGYSGWNSRWVLLILDRVVSRPTAAGASLVTVFLGANDAVLPSERQHVPLDEYVERTPLLCSTTTTSLRRCSVLLLPLLVERTALLLLLLLPLL